MRYNSQIICFCSLEYLFTLKHVQQNFNINGYQRCAMALRKIKAFLYISTAELSVLGSLVYRAFDNVLHYQCFIMG